MSSWVFKDELEGGAYGELVLVDQQDRYDVGACGRIVIRDEDGVAAVHLSPDWMRVLALRLLQDANLRDSCHYDRSPPAESVRAVDVLKEWEKSR